MRTATPPPAICAQLADNWHTTSVHEAGHAVVGITLRIDIREVWLAYQRHRTWAGSQWTVAGRTETVIDGDEPPAAEMSDDDLNDAIVFVWAGLEAEALWLVQRDGLGLAAARRLVAAARVHRQGDLASLAKYHRDRRARWSKARAQRVAHDLVRRHWASIDQVAVQLRARGRIDGREIYQVVSTNPR